MTIGAIGGSRQPPVHESAGAGGIESELALLAVKEEQADYASNQKSEQAERAAKRAHDREEVAAMHAKASDGLTGSLIGGGLQVVGGGMQMASAQYQYSADRTSASADQMAADGHPGDAAEARLKAAEPRLRQNMLNGGASGVQGAATMTKGIYDSRAENDGADATGAKHSSEDAAWRADQASKRKDRAQHDLDQKLSTVQALQQADAQAGAAIVLRG